MTIIKSVAIGIVAITLWEGIKWIFRIIEAKRETTKCS